MAFFVVERSRDDGTLSIPLPNAYESRDAAITALAAATAAGEIGLLGEVFIADLGSAVPVLVMPSAPAVAPSAPEVAPIEEPEPEPAAEEAVEAEPEPEAMVEEPAVEVSEPVAPEAEDTGELDEAAADGAFTSWEPLGEITDVESTLADALKRAATSLEDEGIVAPDSIVSGEELEAPVADEDLEAAAVEEPEAAMDEAASGDTSAWPWANVESYEIRVDTGGLLETEDEPLDEDATEPPVETVVLEDSPIASEIVAEEQPIITSAPADGEDAYMPQPVILGDYPDTPAAAEPAPEGETPSAEEPSPSEILAELDDEEAPLMDLIGEPDVGEPEPVAAEEPATATAESVPEVGYEATGELKLEEYTCQDCVYSNTCPKVGQTTPAECGSFQWRSE